MKYVLTALLAANCIYGVGVALWPAALPTRIAAPPALDVPALRLLSEGARIEVVEPQTALIDPAMPPSVLVQEEPQPERCLISAPFADLVQARRVIDSIQAGGTAVELIESQVRAAPADYLVYIEAPNSRSRSKGICERIGARGLECHEIPTGIRAGALSVGVFSRLELAQNQLDRVAALGFATHLTPLGPPHIEYRLMMPAVATDMTPANISWDECASIADVQGLL